MSKKVRDIPDLDGLTCPLCSIDTSTVDIEVSTECEIAIVLDRAASILKLIWGIDIAVLRKDLTSEEVLFGCLLDLGSSIGVQSHLVGEIIIDAFDNINLA